MTAGWERGGLRYLAINHLGDSGSQKRMTEPTQTMAEMEMRWSE